MAPGAVGGSIYGDERGEYGGVMDDIQLVEPDVGGAYMGSDTGMAWDMVEEAEIVTAGATAQYYGSASGLVSINKLVSLVESIGGVKLKRTYDLNAPKGVAGHNSDNTFIKKTLRWEPSTPLSKGLAKTYKWIQQQYADRKAGKRTVRDTV